MGSEPLTILGLDPGGTSGAVLIRPTEAKWEMVIADNIQEQDFFRWVNTWNQPESPWQIGIVACENFILRPKQMQRSRIPWEQMWLKLPVLEMIGAVKLKCLQLKIPVVLQEPSIKPVGYKHAGLEYKKGEHTLATHLKDATAHAVYLMRNGYKK